MYPQHPRLGLADQVKFPGQSPADPGQPSPVVFRPAGVPAGVPENIVGNAQHMAAMPAEDQQRPERLFRCGGIKRRKHLIGQQRGDAVQQHGALGRHLRQGLDQVPSGFHRLEAQPCPVCQVPGDPLPVFPVCRFHGGPVIQRAIPGQGAG